MKDEIERDRKTAAGSPADDKSAGEKVGPDGGKATASPENDQSGDGKVERDEMGRWKPGCKSPWPKGRRKKSECPPDYGDIGFLYEPQTYRTAKGPKTMSRKEWVKHKIFTEAMSGKVSQQRFLYREFQREEEALAELMEYQRALVKKYITDAPDHGKNMPEHIRDEIYELKELFNGLGAQTRAWRRKPKPKN